MALNHMGNLGVAGVGLVSLMTFFLNGCSQPSTTSSSSPTTSTPGQTATAPQLSGTSALKVVVPSRADSTDMQRKADAVAAFLSKQVGMSVEAIVADDAAAVEALRANRADVAFLSSRPALKADQLANSKVYLAEVRPNYSGGYTYRSIFVVPKGSSLQSKASTKASLEQLKGKRIAFTSPTSGSGFIFPVGELVKEGLVPSRDRLDGFFAQVTYGNNYSGALQAVLRGQADVAAVSEYALKAPYITEAESQKLRILAAIPGVPAHGVAIDDDVPTATRGKLVAALMQLNEPANNALLKDLYNSTGLTPVEHNQHLAPMKEALQRAGIQL